MIKLWQTTNVSTESSRTDASSYRSTSCETIYYWDEDTDALIEETIHEFSWPKRPDQGRTDRSSRTVAIDEVPDRVVEELEKRGFIKRFANKLAANPALLTRRDKKGRTPLHLAEKLREVEALIAAGADVDAADAEGNTPLHAADNSEDVIRAVIKGGANVDSLNKLGQTPLHSAICRDTGFPKIVKILVDAGASIDVQDELGQTPLFCAVHAGHSPEIVKTLADAGADPLIPDNHGTTIYTAKLRHPCIGIRGKMKQFLDDARKNRMKPWSWK